MDNIRRNKLEEIAEKTDNIKCEGEESYDNLPDGIKDSDKGQIMDSNVNCLEEEKKKGILVALEKKTLANNDRIDLSNKNVMLYYGDTEAQTGEKFKVLEIAFDEHYNLFVRTDWDENEIWPAEELSSYELELLLNEVE